MKKLITILLFTLFSFTTLNAQYFNERVDFSSAAETAFNVVENDSGYIMLGGVSGGGLGIVQVDFNGNVMFQKPLSDTNFAFFAGLNNSLTKLTNGGYALYGSKVELATGDIFSILFRFDEAGDTLWTKTYGATPLDQAGQHMRQTLDGGFILMGDSVQFNSKIWVIKTDSLGTIEWQKTYGGPGNENAKHIAICADGGYIFTARTESGGVNPPAGNIRITKIDSLGNVEFNKFYGLSLAEVSSSIEQTIDGGYIFGGGITLPSNSLSHPYVMRLDNLGDTLWTRIYPAPTGNSSLNYINTIYELPDNTFIAAGMNYFTDSVVIGKNVGFIVKIKTNGDTLWRKEYTILPGPGSFHEIKDIRSTSDGGFICAGTISPLAPDTGTQDMWIFKIDSNGCVDTSNCYVSVGVTEEVTHSRNKLLVYPNPSNTIVNFELPFNSTSKSAQLFLFDITGKEIFAIKVITSTIQIDVSNYPKGIYFYRYFDKKQQFNYSGKFIIQ